VCVWYHLAAPELDTPILVQPTDITRTQYTKCRLCSASWSEASNARNMQRPLILNKFNTKSASRWFTVLILRTKWGLNLVEMQEIRWDISRRLYYPLFCTQKNENHEQGAGYFVHQTRLSAVSNRLSHTVLRSLGWYRCSESACTNWQDTWWFGQFLWGSGAGIEWRSRYHMKILWGDFNAKLWR
jgi:hypothetical protein